MKWYVHIKPSADSSVTRTFKVEAPSIERAIGLARMEARILWQLQGNTFLIPEAGLWPDGLKTQEENEKSGIKSTKV